MSEIPPTPVNTEFTITSVATEVGALLKRDKDKMPSNAKIWSIYRNETGCWSVISAEERS